MLSDIIAVGTEPKKQGLAGGISPSRASGCQDFFLFSTLLNRPVRRRVQIWSSLRGGVVVVVGRRQVWGSRATGRCSPQRNGLGDIHDGEIIIKQQQQERTN